MMKLFSVIALSLFLWGKAQAAVPAVPVLVSPSTDAMLQPISFTASWGASAGATSYQLQISVNKNFTNPIIDLSGITDLYKAVGPLLNGTVYHWRVLARNADGASAFTLSRTFTTIVAIPVAVTLGTPGNAASNQALQPILKWRKLTGTDSYHLQISTNATFTGTLILDQVGILDTTFTPATLTVSTPFFWRVSAKNAGGDGPYSAGWSFNTVPALPSVPALIGPLDAAVQNPLPLILNWHKANRATTYNLQISLVNTFATLVLDTTFVNPDTTLTYGKLKYGTQYFWRVRSKNPGGNSAFSGTWDFSTLEIATAPILVKPTDLVLDEPVDLGLFWRKTARAVTYRLQVSTNPAFTGTLIVNDSTITDTTRLVSALDNKTAYYWRVNAKNAAGTSAFSPSRKFTTIILILPSVPILVSPKDAASAVSSSPVFKWNPTARTVTYHLQVSLTPTFGVLAFNDTTLKDTTKAVSGLKNGEIYYWRVNARNDAGTSAYSEIRSFTTLAGAASEPVLVTPADNAVNVSRTPALIWKTALNAVTYQLQVSTHADFTIPVVNDSTISDTNVNMAALTNGTLYYWHVRSVNTAGKSDYSPSRKFTVIIGAPLFPILIFPLDNAVDQERSLTLKWNSVAAAVSYRWQLSTTATFSSLVMEDSTLADTTKTITVLQAGTVYFWRVQAKNVGGVGAYSEIRSFKTKPVVGVKRLRTIKSEGFTVLGGRAFGQSSELEFSVLTNAQVHITLINPTNGRSIEILNRKVEAGTYRLPLSAKNHDRGIVFLSMTAGDFRQTQKVFLP